MSTAAADDASTCSPSLRPRRATRVGDVEQVGARHAAVPPTVSSVTRSVGDAVADGDALAVLAARAGVAHGEVVADGVDRR